MFEWENNNSGTQFAYIYHGSESNVYLRVGKTITIGKPFLTDSKIGICPEKTIKCEDIVDVTVFGTNVTAEDISSNFKPDIIGQEIVYQNDKVQLTVKHDFSTTWSHDADNHWHECSKCGAKNDNVKHDWVTDTILATCLEDGSQKDTCKDCGRTTGETKLEATGHDWGEWTPSLTDPDIEISVCNNDPAHTQEREIARDPDPDPEPPKPSVPTAPPVIRPTVTTVPSGTTITTVKNTTTTMPPDTTTTTTTTPASAKTIKPKKTTTAPETTSSGKTTAKTTTPAADPPAALTIVPAEADENPKTGVAVSLIPLVSAMIVLTVAVKRNRK